MSVKANIVLLGYWRRRRPPIPGCYRRIPPKTMTHSSTQHPPSWPHSSRLPTEIGDLCRHRALFAFAGGNLCRMSRIELLWRLPAPLLCCRRLAICRHLRRDASFGSGLSGWKKEHQIHSASMAIM